MRSNWKWLALVLAVFLLLPATGVASAVPMQLPFQGRATDSAGSPINYPVEMKFRIFGAGGTCYLYEETYNSLTPNAYGLFSIMLGAGTSTGPANTFAAVFNNDPSTPITDSCGDPYSPALNEARELEMVVDGTSLGRQTIGSAAFSINSQMIGGRSIFDLIQKISTVTQANLTTLTDTSDASALHNHDSIYVRRDGANQFSGNVSTTGDIIASGSNSTIIASGTLASVGIGTTSTFADLHVKKDAPRIRLESNAGSGQTATLEFYGGATERARIETSESTNGLRFYSGSNLSMSIDSAGSLTVARSMKVTGTLGLGTYSSSDETNFLSGLGASGLGTMWVNSDTGNIRYWNGTTFQTLWTLTPSGVTAGTYGNSTTIPSFAVDANGRITSVAPVAIALPTTQLNATGANSGDLLKWNGSAWLPAVDDALRNETDPSVQSWAKNAPTSRFVTTGSILDLALSGVTAGTFGSATQVPVVTIDAFGRVTSATTTTITGVSPAGSSLNDGNIWVGNVSNQAAAVALTGDIALSNSGSVTVNRVKGQLFSGNAPSLGSLLVYNNIPGHWEALTLPSCSTSETLQFNSLTGSFSCGTINNATNFTGNLAGDITGTQGATTLSKLRGQPVTITALATRDILQYNGSAWVNANIPSCGSNQYLSYNGTYFCATDAGASGTVASLTANNPLSVNVATGAVTVSLNYDNLTIGLNGSNALEVKDASITAAKLGGGVNGDVLYKTGGAWTAGTPNAANLVDLSSAQTLSGNKTFTGNLIHNSSGATQVASGSTAQRPGTPAVGMIRANSSNSNRPEYYNGSSWVTFGTGDGTISSIDIDVPSILTASGGPITSGAGTLSLSLATQSANMVFAGPTTGSAAPTFRSLAASDIPALDATKVATGTLPVSRGGTGSVTPLTNNKVMVSSGGAIVEGDTFGSTKANNSYVVRDGSGGFAAGAVTVDSSILKGSSSGSVTLQAPATVTSYTLTLPNTVGSAGQMLMTNASGSLSWGTPNVGSVTAVSSANSYITVTNGSTTPTINANIGTAANTLAAGDDSRIVGALQRAGGTMSGDLFLANNDLNTVGNIYMSANKLFGLSQYTGDPVTGTWGAAEKGRTWFNASSNEIKYWDGTSVKILGIAGSGVQTLNGLAANNQSFAVGSTGTDFGITSSGSVHTFNLPTASASNRGLLSSSDFSTFTNKLSSSSQFAGDVSGTASALTVNRIQGVPVTGSLSTNHFLKYNGSAWMGSNLSNSDVTTGLGYAPLQSLNGLTALSQSFVTGTSGTAPEYVSSGSAHTLNIPMASGAGVTAGLLSKSDYDAFTNKLGSVTSFAGDVAGPYSAITVNKLQGQSLALSGGSAGQVLRYNGSAWVNTGLSFADVTSSLGYTPVNRAGDTMSGTLNLGGNDLTNAGNLTMAANKLLGLSQYGADPATGGWGAAEKGRTWFNASSNEIKYWDGSSVRTLGVAGSGLQSLNGLSANSQSFAVGSSGTDFEITSSGSVHTFNLPTSSASNRGLLSSSDFTTFTNKLGTTTSFAGDVSGPYNALTVNRLRGTNVYVGSLASGEFLKYNGSAWVNQVLSSSDVTSGLGYTPVNRSGDTMSGALNLNNNDLAAVASMQLKGSTTGTLTLAAPLSVTSYTLRFPSAVGSAGQVLATDASGNLSWATQSVGGITLINGLSALSQSFAIGTSSTAPEYVSSGSVHTLNIPMASTASVTAGLLSKSDYDAFTNKLGTTTSFAGDVAGPYSAITVNKLQGQSLALSAGSAGQVLRYNGSAWVNTGLSFADVTSSLGYTPVNRAGDTMSGTLNLGGNDLTNAGNLTLAANKLLGLSQYVGDPDTSSWNATEKGRTWFNTSSNEIKYWDGSAVRTLGVSGSGLQNLNGLSANNQSFAFGTSGTDANIVSSGSTHTFNLPTASASNRGLLSSSDFSTFTNKLSSSSQFAGDVSGTVSALTVNRIQGVPVTGSLSTNHFLKYNGSAWMGSNLSNSDVTTGLGYAPLQSLNGLTALSQSFVTGTSGTAPEYVSSGSVHTLNIPMASTASVTAGLLAKTDYDSFAAKLGTTTSFAGDVAGPYSAITVNKLQGQSLALSGGSAGQVLRYNGSAWVNTTLTAADIPSVDAAKITSGTLPVSLGGTGAVSFTGNKVIVSNSAGSALTSLNCATGEVISFDASANVQCQAVNGASQIVRLDSGGRIAASMLPTTALTSTTAFDGDILGTVGATTVSKLRGENLFNSSSISAQYLRFNGSAWMNSALQSSDITTALAYVPVNKAGDTMSGNMNMNGNNVINVGIQTFKDSGSNTVQIKSAATTTSYTLTLPVNPGSANQVLTTDGSGVLTWSTPAGTGMTSLNGSTAQVQTFATPATSGTNAPAWSTNAGTGVHTLTIPMASGASVTAGLISKTDYDTFNSKLSSSTSFGGDVSGFSSALTVTRLQGTAISAAAPASGNFLKYNGSSWAGAGLAAADISSGVFNISQGGTGASALAANGIIVSNGLGTALTSVTCTGAGEYLRWTGAAFACSTNGSALSSLNAANISAGTLGVAQGGTGLVSYTAGDILYATGATTLAKLPIGGAGQVLMSSGSTVSWGTVSAGGSTFTSGGNSFGAAASLGTNDAYTLSFRTNNTNRMTIDTSGNIGIGTTAPTFNFGFASTGTLRSIGVERATAGAGLDLLIGAGSAQSGATDTAGGKLILSSGTSTGTLSSSIEFRTATADTVTGTSDMTPTTKMVILGNGNVGIGTTNPAYAIDVAATVGSGLIRATGLVSTSDGRLKTNVHRIEGLEIISRLTGVTYNWIENGQKDFGLIAQEVEKVLPEAVVTDKNSGYKAVKYQNLVAPLIEATKELKVRCEASETATRKLASENKVLKDQLMKLQEQNANLEKRLRAIEKALEKK